MIDTKVAIAIRDDLDVWQKLNVAAFLSAGIAASAPETIGERYEDGSGNTYLPIFTEPVLVFVATADQLQRTRRRALSRGVPLAIYTNAMFSTYNDEDNRAVVKAVSADNLDLAGVALRTDRKTFDRIVDGLKLHA
jgi:hypothetical protein